MSLFCVHPATESQEPFVQPPLPAMVKSDYVNAEGS